MSPVSQIVCVSILFLTSRMMLLNSLKRASNNECNRGELECYVTDLSLFNFSSIDANATTLRIDCVGHLRHNLTKPLLKHLNKLRNLHLSYCMFDEFNANIFTGLESLENLEIWESTFDSPIENNLFYHSSNIQSVKLFRNIFKQIENDVFCSLKEISILRLNNNNNNFERVNEIGCGDNNTCCPLLHELDLTGQKIRKISNTDFPFSNLNRLVMNNCCLSEIESESFHSLHNLEILILEYNELEIIHEKLFDKNIRLSIIYLSNNKVSCLPNGIFSNLKSLSKLYLNYNLLNFKLNCSKSEYLTERMFDNLTQLGFLDLSYNFITRLTDNHFTFLTKLTNLILSNNTLTHISKNAFNNLTNLKQLFLGGNKVTNIPNMQSLSRLTYLDLSDNMITQIKPKSFFGLVKVDRISLDRNEIINLSKGIFQHTPSLRYISIRGNKISKIESGTFILPNLQELDLSHNQIREMKSLFVSVKLTLILNDNQIDYFNFNCINQSLIEINLDRNQLRKIIPINDSTQNYEIKYFLADVNFLKTIDLNAFPQSIQHIQLSNNTISHFDKFDYRIRQNLTRLNLENNNLTEIDFKNIIQSGSKKVNLSKMKINLKGNPLLCSCLNEWLLDSDKLNDQSITLPRIEKSDTCKPIDSRVKKHRNSLNIMTLERKDFVCETKQNCPLKCTCFFNSNTQSFSVDCFNVTWEDSDLFVTIPTESNQTQTDNNVTIFLDGNTNSDIDINSLLAMITGPFFVARNLYMNNSQLTTIDKKMFQSVPNLTELHLEHNLLSSLDSDEFHFIRKLEQLYLHKNRLQFISTNSFKYLVNLKLLTLHGNQLTQPKLWLIVINVPEITISNNPYECDCQYNILLLKWIETKTVPDKNKTLCFDTSIPIMDYDILQCVQPPQVNLTTIIAPTVAIFVFLTVVVVLMFLYRLEMKVWLYSRHGIRLFYHNQPADKGKKYDAFISYANEDDEWVMEELVCKLDDYLLCIHQRDFPAGGFIVDSVIEAVENSCRTVIILSPNYVNSMWCKFEFDTAHMQSLQDRCKRVVVVILEDVNKSELDKNLQVYLNTNTYLEKSDNLFLEKLKYALPNVRSQPERDETCL